MKKSWKQVLAEVVVAALTALVTAVTATSCAGYCPIALLSMS